MISRLNFSSFDNSFNLINRKVAEPDGLGPSDLDLFLHFLPRLFQCCRSIRDHFSISVTLWSESISINDQGGWIVNKIQINIVKLEILQRVLEESLDAVRVVPRGWQLVVIKVVNSKYSTPDYY